MEVGVKPKRKWKLKVVGVLIAFVLGWMTWTIVSKGGFTETQRKDFKHTVSSAIGLERTCVRYDSNGKIIEQYTGRFKIEVEPGCMTFIDDNNKETKMMGWVTCREK